MRLRIASEADKQPPLLDSLSAGAGQPGPIGIFDSGVGGLSVVREVLAQAPACRLIYIADQCHAPYGQRELDEVCMLSAGITEFLRDEGCSIIVVACNTASAAALYRLREQFPDITFVGMEPAVKPAAQRTRSGRIGVIATAGTFRGEPYAGVVRRFAANITVLAHACPEFVPLVESGDFHSPQAREAVCRHLMHLRDEGIDELVLGCTHYSFLRPLIEECLGPGIEVIDPAAAVARQTVHVAAAKWPAIVTAREPAGEAVFCTTGDKHRFAAMVGDLIGCRGAVQSLAWSGRA
jgi:glutamate racemase